MMDKFESRRIEEGFTFFSARDIVEQLNRVVSSSSKISMGNIGYHGRYFPFDCWFMAREIYGGLECPLTSPNCENAGRIVLERGKVLKSWENYETLGLTLRTSLHLKNNLVVTPSYIFVESRGDKFYSRSDYSGVLWLPDAVKRMAGKFMRIDLRDKLPDSIFA